MAHPHRETINILVDGAPTTLADFLTAHRYVDKEWRKDIEFDLGSNGESAPNDNQRPWAQYSIIKMAPA